MPSWFCAGIALQVISIVRNCGLVAFNDVGGALGTVRMKML